MKKILLFLVALITMGGAKAEKRYLTFETADYCAAKWNAETNTLTWGSGGWNPAFTFMTAKGVNGNLSSWTKLHLNVSDFTNSKEEKLHIVFKTDDGAWPPSGPTYEVDVTPDVSGNIDIDLSSVVWGSCDITNIADLTIYGCERTDNTVDASVKVTEAYLYRPTTLQFNENGVAEISITDIVATGGLSFDDKTGVVTSDGQEGELVITFVSPVDLSSLTNFSVSTSGYSNLINYTNFKKQDNTNVHNTSSWYSSKFNLYFNAEQAARAKDVTTIFFHSNGCQKEGGETDEDYATRLASYKAQSLTLSKLVVKANVISVAKTGESSLKNLPWNKIDGSGTATPDWNMNVSTDTYYGNYSGDPTHYVDLTSYDELRIYRDKNDGFRAFFINAAGSATNQVNSGSATWNDEGKYWSLDLSTVEKYNEMIALKCIKSASSGVNNVVNNIVVYDASATNDAQYVFVGKGILSPAAQAALEDATVTLIDATGVTGTGVTLTPANPNAILKANAGVLANTKNVMVGTTIANLELTDGYPFAVPSGATATAATYTRSMSNKYGTVCLPYEVASTDAVKYYTIESLAANELTLKAEATLSAGTPAIVEMVSGSSITATGSGALAEAGAPTDNLKLIGTYEAKTILASDYAGKGIYAISNNQFVQATNSINLPAFRAFFTAASAESNIRLVFDDDATAIDALSGEGDVTIEGIYSLDGAEMPSLQKGINIVKFSNGEVKKVIVK